MAASKEFNNLQIERWFQQLPAWLKEQIRETEPSFDFETFNNLTEEWAITCGDLNKKFIRPLKDDETSLAVMDDASALEGMQLEKGNIMLLDADGLWSITEMLIHTTLTSFLDLLEKYQVVQDIKSEAVQFFSKEEFTREVYVRLDLTALRAHSITDKKIIAIHHSPTDFSPFEDVATNLPILIFSISSLLLTTLLFPPLAGINVLALVTESAFTIMAFGAGVIMVPLLKNKRKWCKLNLAQKSTYAYIRYGCPKKIDRISFHRIRNSFRRLHSDDSHRQRTLVSLSNWQHGSKLITPVGKGGSLKWKRAKHIIPGKPKNAQQMVTYLPFNYKIDGTTRKQPVNDGQIKQHFLSADNNLQSSLNYLENNQDLIWRSDSQFAIKKYLF